MIKNERQFKVSTSRANDLRCALDELRDLPLDPGLHPQLRDLQLDALAGQLSDIESEISDYTTLVDSPPTTIVVDSLHELPRALIRARIAAGITHRGLAARLGLKEQAVQRYEASEYASANFARLTAVADALGVQVHQEFHLTGELSPRVLVRRLQEAGVGTKLLERRFLAAGESVQTLGPDHTGQLVKDLERVFGWTGDDLRSSGPLEPRIEPQLAASFKKPINANDEATRAYVVYAHYLALQVAGLVERPLRTPPKDWKELRDALLEAEGEVTLRGVLNYTWDLGIAVLPLQDRIAIHGAFWNFSDRGAIVLKQGMRTTSRWLVDLLHELYHAATETSGVVDGIDIDSDIESLANDYAADVVLGGRSEKLFEAAVAEANGNMANLKQAVQVVASRECVPLGVFANALAWRLSPDHDWWGVAANLQKGEPDPWEVVRDVMLERADLSKLPEPDQRLVMAALRDERDL